MIICSFFSLRKRNRKRKRRRRKRQTRRKRKRKKRRRRMRGSPSPARGGGNTSGMFASYFSPGFRGSQRDVVYILTDQ